jgi:hypothetical protein
MASAVDAGFDWLRRRWNDEHSVVHQLKHAGEDINAEFFTESIESVIARTDLRQMISSPGLVGWFFSVLMFIPAPVVLYLFTALTALVRHQHFVPFTNIPIPRFVSNVIGMTLGAVGPGLLDAIRRFHEEETERRAFHQGVATAQQNPNPIPPQGGPVAGNTRGNTPAPGAAQPQPAPGAPPPPPIPPVATGGGGAGAAPPQPPGGGGQQPPAPPQPPPPVPDPFAGLSQEQRDSWGVLNTLMELRRTDLLTLPSEANSLNWLLRNSVARHPRVLDSLPVFEPAAITQFNGWIDILRTYVGRPVTGLSAAERQERADTILSVHAFTRNYGTFISSLRAVGTPDMSWPVATWVGFLDTIDDRVTQEQRDWLAVASRRVFAIAFGAPGGWLRFFWQIFVALLTIAFVLFGLSVGAVTVAGTLFGLSLGFLGMGAMLILTAALFYGLYGVFSPVMIGAAFTMNALGIMSYLVQYLAGLYDMFIPSTLQKQVEVVDHVDKDKRPVMKTKLDEQGRTVPYTEPAGFFAPIAQKVALVTALVMFMLNAAVFIPQGMYTRPFPYAGIVVIIWLICILNTINSLFGRSFTPDEKRNLIIRVTYWALQILLVVAGVTMFFAYALTPTEQGKVVDKSQRLGSGMAHVVVGATEEATARVEDKIEDVKISRIAADLCEKRRQEELLRDNTYCDAGNFKGFYPCVCD